MKFCVFILLAAGAAFAQAPAFEVASIKPAGPLNPAAIMQGKMRIGVNVDNARVDMNFLSLSDLIRSAYKVKSYQISGPDWMNSERFDISAKMPEGANKDQVPDMLKSLLAERFHLATHTEKKEHQVYALIQMKGGAKLKESEPDPAAPPPAEGGKGALSLSDGENRVSVSRSGDGRGAVISTGKGGKMKMGMTPEGNMRMEGSGMPIEGLTEMLTRFVDKPIVDETNLKGRYDITLDLSPDDMKTLMRSAMAMMGPGMGPVPAAAAAETASDPAGGSIFTALQKMGLKLETRKEMIDMIVVDRVEKTPTEN